MKKRYIAFAVLLVLTSAFIVQLAYSSEHSEQRIPISGCYQHVKPISLQQPPDPNEYIVLNYTYRSEMLEEDLVYVLENWDWIWGNYERAYKEGGIPEYNWQLLEEWGPSGRVTEQVKELCKGKDAKYILWQPQNRWFNMTFGLTLDFERPESIRPALEASSGTGLAVSWVALAIYAVKKRNDIENSERKPTNSFVG